MRSPRSRRSPTASARPRRSATRLTRMSRRVSSPPYEMETGSRVGNGGFPSLGGTGKQRQPATPASPQKEGAAILWTTPETRRPPEPLCGRLWGSRVDVGGSSDRSPADLIHEAGASAGLGLLIVDADGEGVLAGTTPGPLEGDWAAVDEHLPTPDTPGLLALLGAGKAGGAQGAGAAEPLGPLQLAGRG